MTAPIVPAVTDPADPNAPTDPAGQAGAPAGTEPPKDVPNPRVAELETKFAQASQELADAKTKLTNLEREKMDETERTKAERDEIKEKYDEAVTALADRAIENAFLMSNKFTWHNPATALRLLERGELKVAADGTVSGIDAAIEALSKSDPYLLKSENDGGTSGSNKGGNAGGGSTGSQPGTGGGTKDPAAADRSKLEKKYPAIRR